METDKGDRCTILNIVNTSDLNSVNLNKAILEIITISFLFSMIRFHCAVENLIIRKLWFGFFFFLSEDKEGVFVCFLRQGLPKSFS